MREPLVILLLLGLNCVWAHQNSVFFSKRSAPQSGIADRCFCELKGKVDECECSVDYVDQFNNNKVFPRLKSILAKNYFRFFKVNLKKPCPFWYEDQECTMRHCAVQSCTEENMPPGILEGSNTSEFGPSNDPALHSEPCDHDSELGFLNTTLTKQMSADIAKWTVHDENQNTFCDIDDEQHNDSVFVDLLLNPERYTGYKGTSAQRIWKAIYEENCFKPKRGYGPYIDSTNVGDLCLEKRAFYRALSGLHTSINIHLCAEYLHGHGASHLLSDGSASNRWGPNLEEFQRRFDPELTNGEGPQRLRNLYFVYLLEMRAIAKASPFLERFHYYTGNAEEDQEMKTAVKDLLSHVNSFGAHFNESSMFSGGRQAKKLKEEFRHHFLNISRIMDCVGCEKCKLWGKLQIQGLGTALKILFSGSFDQPDPTAFDLETMKKTRFQLSRNEIVALFNAFGRLSTSISRLESFRNPGPP